MLDFYTDILKDEEFRKKNGAYFTNSEIVVKICTEVLNLCDKRDLTDFKFLDLASGTGVFSYYLASLLSSKFNINFIDIINNCCVMAEKDDEFVNKTYEIFDSLGCSPTIIHGDALFSEELDECLFDVVVSNPPYIRLRNLELEYRLKLKSTYKSCMFGMSDIYYAFFERAFELLKLGGILGFITPSSYLRSESGRYLRALLSNHIVKIVDFGSDKKFNCGVYTALTFAKKVQYDLLSEPVGEFTYEINNKKLNIGKAQFLKDKFFVEDNKLQLKDVCDIRGGIATLRDKIFIIKPDSIDNDYIYISDFKIERKAVYPLIKLSEIKYSEDVNNIKYYCIFPYKGDLTNFTHFKDEEEFKSYFPYTFEYLLYYKSKLLTRDKGKPKSKYKWYEFGRTQGIIDNVGDVILTSTMNLKPNFIKANISGKLVKSGLVLYNIQCDIDDLLDELNSDEMVKFISMHGQKYANNWRGYSKRILQYFPIREDIC